MDNQIQEKIAIVTVGYNRPDAMKRLLMSVIEADYGNDCVDLIVSIDRGERRDEIEQVAADIPWNHGEKIICKHEERLGLKQHILSCGDRTKDYAAVVVLEDDLTVSKGFYRYVKSALEKYGDDSRIAGISLYTFQTIPYSTGRFIADNNGYDAFLMQIAMSWGQCWSKKMWKEFKAWYQDHSGPIPRDGILPEAVVNWGDKSWLKYYDRYVAECDKYYVYSYIALSTDHTEIGEHAKNTSTMFEVPLLNGVKDFRFPDFDDAVRYDAYFERMDIDFAKLLGVDKKVLVDINGLKSRLYDGEEYILSSAALPCKIEQQFGITLKPIEENIVQKVPGEGLFLYNTKISEKAGKRNHIHRDRYDLYDSEWRQSLRFTAWKLKQLLKDKLFRKK